MTKTIYLKIEKLLDLLIQERTIEEGVDDIVYEEAERPSEIIQACAGAISVIDSMDDALMYNTDRERIKSIKRKCLRLTHESINAIYETNINED